MIRRLAGIGLTVLVAAGMFTQPAAADSNPTYVDAAYYIGSRFYDHNLCVEDRTRTSQLQWAVANGTTDININTNLRMWYRRGANTCTAYYATAREQRIIVVDGYYGRTGWVGRVRNGSPAGSPAGVRVCSATVTVECVKWGRTARGQWTYIHYRFVVVELNRSYAQTTAQWDHIATHEILHAVGVDHINSTCASVMSQRPGCSWISYLASVDRGQVNDIYAQ